MVIPDLGILTFRRQELQGCRALESEILGPIDEAYPALGINRKTESWEFAA
jgi:hypothetical protein